MSAFEQLFVFESVHEDAPFNARHNEEIVDLFFKDADKYTRGNMTVWDGGQAGSVLVQRVKSGMDKDRNGILDSDEVDENFILRIFVGRNKSQLEKAFNQYEPKEREMCLFIEDNTTDTFSNTFATLGEVQEGGISVYSKVPPEFKAWLKTEFESFLANTGDIGFNIALTRASLLQLIEEGFYKFSSIKEIDLAIRAFQVGFKAVYSGFKWLGDEVFRLTNDIRKAIQVPEWGWNPNFSSEDGKHTKDSFRPFLLPGITTLMDLGKAGSDQIKHTIMKEIYKLKEGLLVQLKGLTRFANLYHLPGREWFERSIVKAVNKCYYELIHSVVRHFEFFEFAGRELVYVINAYYSGLWNSLVDAVLGVVDMVGCIFYAIGMFYKAGEKAPEIEKYWDQISELIDEFIQTVRSLSAKDFFSAGIDALMYLWRNVNKDSLSVNFGITLSHIAYFIGGVAAFVLEIAIDILTSGGVKSIQTTISKLGTFAKTLKALFKDVIGAAGDLAADVFLFVVDLIDWVIVQLRKGPDGLQELVRDAAKYINAGFKVIDELMLALDQLIADWAEDIAARVGHSGEQIKKGWEVLKQRTGKADLEDFANYVTCK